MAKILIIDDDPDMVLAARLCLENAGHEVYEAASSREGLSSIEQVRPDIIILDVMMDTTTSGFQLALTLRSPDPNSPYAEYANIPIIMLTAIHTTSPVKLSPDSDYLPVDAFIDKPIDPTALLKQIEEILAK
nr:response regulator [Anaerolineae bacterium]